MFQIKITARFLLSIAGFFLLAAIAARPAFAVQCGDVIQTDLKLTANLNCTGNGLRVFGPLPGAPNITIDLNGHDITGDGTGMGVFIFDGQVTLKGRGRISNFEVGVSLITARDVEIYDLTIENNQAGIALFRSSRVRMFDNTIRAGANGLSGVIMSVVSHTALYRNTISGFSDVGVIIPSGDPPDESIPVISENIIRENQTGISIRGLDSDSIIRGNHVVDNKLNGIEIASIFEAGCTIQENQVLRNGGHGILLQGGDLTGCLIANNLVEKNGLSGINILEDVQPRNQGILVEGNRLSRNGTDLLWDGVSNSCWLQNVFVTSSPLVLPKCPL
ncbi:MAG: right-handed parallel beta-helix repeat-containing protein [Acidobacteriia bacterium]|nr:right-handed parallel beta-helix repeat-containing protein [Terriglobia bacterium]